MNTTKKCSKPLQKKSAFSRFVRVCKRIYWGRVALAVLSILGVIYLGTLLVGAFTNESAESVEPIETEAPVEYIFKDGNGEPVNVQSMTDAWAAEYGTAKRYELTDAERWTVASVVTAEAGAEPFAGKMAVAQCILQACEDDEIRPTEAVVKYKYAKSRPNPSAEAMEAVQAVFDLGQVVTNEPIKYFYAPARCFSEWHESQEYVVTINGHKFFKEAK